MMNKGLVLEKASTVDIAASLDLLAIIESMRGKQVAFNHQVRDIGLTSICSFIHMSTLKNSKTPKIPNSDVTVVLHICKVDQYPFHWSERIFTRRVIWSNMFCGAFVVYCKYSQNCGTYWESERDSVWGENSNSIFNFFCFVQIAVQYTKKCSDLAISPTRWSKEMDHPVLTQGPICLFCQIRD